MEMGGGNFREKSQPLSVRPSPLVGQGRAFDSKAESLIRKLLLAGYSEGEIWDFLHIDWSKIGSGANPSTP